MGFSVVLGDLGDVGPLCEWDLAPEETLGVGGMTSFAVQDRDGSLFGNPSRFKRQPVDIVLDDGWVLFHGLVQNVEFSAPVGMPWGKYTFHCTDYAGERLDKYYVGIPEHLIWKDESGNKVYGSWKGTAGYVQEMIEYFKSPSRGVPTGSGGEPWMVYYANPYFESQTLRSAMETLAGLEGANIQFWFDPDDVFHWEAIPRWWELAGPDEEHAPTLILGKPAQFVRDDGAFLMMFPTWPVTVTWQDMSGVDFDGVRGLAWSLDFSQEVHRVWVNGGTYVSDGQGLAIGQVDPNLGKLMAEWVYAPSPPWPELGPGVPEAVMGVEFSTSVGGLGSYGARLMKQTYNGVLRGKMTVGCEHRHPDGWRVGQYLQLQDERLPGFLRDRYVVIQKVTTHFLAGVDWRVYDIEWGDAPQGRITSLGAGRTSTGQAAAAGSGAPGQRYWAGNNIYHAYDGDVILITGQLVTASGDSKHLAGVNVPLVVYAWDPQGAPQATPTDVYVDPATATTNIMGYWETYLHVGANVGWSFQVMSAGQIPPKGHV